MNTDFIVPLETKLEAEEKNLMVCSAHIIKKTSGNQGVLLLYIGNAQELQTGEWKERVGMYIRISHGYPICVCFLRCWPRSLSRSDL